MPVPTSKADRLYSTNVEDFPIPNRHLEEWRFTPVKKFRDLYDIPSDYQKWNIKIAQEGAATLTERSVEDAPVGIVGKPFDRPAALAWSNTPVVHVLECHEGDHSAEPTSLNIAGPGESETAFGHLVINVPEHSRSSVLIYRDGSGNLSDNIEISLGDGADLTLAVVALYPHDAVITSAHHIEVGRDAHIRHGLITLGGGTSRTTVSADYAGPGGDVELLGLFFGGAGEHVENRLLVDHNQPHCRSNVMYKGALMGDPHNRGGEAHAVWVGDVLIRQDAVGVETFETNRNLLLNKAARVDSIPNLEIEAGNIVGAGHASTTGRFDEDQLFYLQARGIDEVTARQLVVRGFFHDLIHKLNLPTLEEEIDNVVTRQLERVGI